MKRQHIRRPWLGHAATPGSGSVHQVTRYSSSRHKYRFTNKHIYKTLLDFVLSSASYLTEPYVCLYLYSHEHHFKQITQRSFCSVSP